MEFTVFPVLDVIESAAADNCDVWTAVCDMRSMIARGGVTCDAMTAKAVSSALLTGYEQLPQEFWPQLVVMAMARLQGLCPNATWDQWQLINGC